MLKIHTRYAGICLLGLGFIVLAALAPAGSSYEVGWYTLDTGGGTSTGGSLQVDGTIGQPDTQSSSGASYVVQGGFWGAFPLPCDGDADGSGSVDVVDLLALLGDWGPCPAPPSSCPTDINDDTQVDVVDLLGLLGGWGACP